MYDLPAQVLRLPRARRLKYMEQIRLLLDPLCTSCTRKEAEQLIGRLQFATAVVTYGQLRLRALRNALRHVPEHGRVRISAQIRSDLQWWYDRLQEKPCLRFRWVVMRNVARADVPGLRRAWSDASTKFGAGGFVGHDFWQCTWEAAPIDSIDKSINWMEVVAGCVMVLTFAPGLRGQHLILKMDNMAAVCMVNARDAKHAHFLAPLRDAFNCARLFEVFLTAQYVDTHTNIVGDTLSRCFPVAEAVRALFGLRRRVEPCWPPSLLRHSHPVGAAAQPTLVCQALAVG
jgi:hypothetical protein